MNFQFDYCYFVDHANNTTRVPPLDATCADDAFRLDMRLEPGDAQWLHNHTTFHARSAYERGSDDERSFSPATREQQRKPKGMYSGVLQLHKSPRPKVMALGGAGGTVGGGVHDEEVQTKSLL